MEDIHEKQQYVTVELHDAQLERIEALMERNIARQETIASELRGDIRVLNVKIDGIEKKVDARIDGVMDAIAMTNMRIDDLKSQQSNTLAKWGIIIAIGVCVVQVITSIILRFV